MSIFDQYPLPAGSAPGIIVEEEILHLQKPADLEISGVQWTRNGTAIPGAEGPSYDRQGVPGRYGITLRIGVELARTIAPSYAPLFVTQPTITPSLGDIGAVFTITLGAATGSPKPKLQLVGLTQGGIDVLDQVTNGKFRSTAPGPVIASVAAYNGVSPSDVAYASAIAQLPRIAARYTTEPDMQPRAGLVGTVFTLTTGAATGSPAPVSSLTQLTQDGVDVLDQVVNGTFTSTQTGDLVAVFTAENGVMPEPVKIFVAQVNPLPDMAPVFDVAPALTPATGEVGQVYTIDLGTVNARPDATLTLSGLTQDGVDVLGEMVEGRFTSTAAGQIIATVTASNGILPDATRTMTAEVTPRTLFAPIAISGLNDVAATLNTALPPIDVASRFDGEDIVYSVIGSGASINAQTGLLTLSSSTLRDAGTIKVTATNATGSAAIAFSFTVTPEAGGQAVIFRQPHGSQDYVVAGNEFYLRWGEAWHPNGQMVPSLVSFEVGGVDRSGDLVTASPSGIFDMSGSLVAGYLDTAGLSGAWSAQVRWTDLASGDTILSDTRTGVIGPYLQPDVPMTWTERSIITVNGETLDFGSNILMGTGARGHLFIKSDRPIPRPQRSLGASQQDFAVKQSNDSYAQTSLWCRGAQKFVPGSTWRMQGFNELAGTDAKGARARKPYNHTLNEDFNVTGAGTLFASGEIGHFVMTDANLNATTDTWGVIPNDGWTAFTVVAVDPPADAMPPGWLDPWLTEFIRERDINAGGLPDYDASGFSPTPDSVTNYLAPLPNYAPHGLATSGESLRRMMPVQGPTSSNYSADMSAYISDMLMLCCTNHATATEKQAAVEWAVTWALQIDASIKAGYGGAAGAGQHFMYQECLALAALALNSRQIEDRILDINSNVTGQVRWITADDLGFGVYFGDPRYRQCFMSEHVGRVAWVQEPPKFARQHSSLVDERYHGTSSKSIVRALMFIGMLSGLPSGANGVQLMRGGPDTRDNRRAAIWPHFDEFMSLDFNGYNAYSPGAVMTRMYGAHRDKIPIPVHDFPPLQPDARGEISALDGGFSWEASAFDGSAAPVTARHVYRSWDGRQFHKMDAAGAAGTYTDGIHGAMMAVQFTLENQFGESLPSVNFPYDSGMDRRNEIITGIGANPGPAVNIAPPEILKKEYPLYPASRYISAANSAVDEFVFAAGVGDWRGGQAAPGISWQIGGVEVGTGDTYTRTTLDAIPDLSLVTEVSGVSARSPVISLPAVAGYPPGTVVDTTFGHDFLLRHQASWSARQSSNINAGSDRINPNIDFSSIGAGTGAWEFQRNGDFPSQKMPFDLVVGQEYEARIVMIANWEATARNLKSFFSNVQLRVGQASSDEGSDHDRNYLLGLRGLETKANGGAQAAVTFTTTFTALTDTCWITIRGGSGSGGVSGSLFYMSALSIKQTP